MPQVGLKQPDHLKLGFNHSAILIGGSASCRLGEQPLAVGLVPSFFGFGPGLTERGVGLVERRVPAADHHRGRRRDGCDERQQKSNSGAESGDPAIAKTPTPKPLGAGDRPRHDRLSRLISAQVLGHREDIRVAARGLLLEALQTDRLHVAGGSWAGAAREGRAPCFGPCPGCRGSMPPGREAGR